MVNMYIHMNINPQQLCTNYFFFCTIGSPCDTKVGLERRTIVFKHAIQVLNDGDVSNKVFTTRLYFVLVEFRMKKISTEFAQLKMQPQVERE